MAVKKKRRATKKKVTKAKKAAVGSKKIAGLKYDPAGCFETKSAAQKSAETLRQKGKKARVIPNKSGKGACIYVR